MLQLDITIRYRIKKSHPDYNCLNEPTKRERLRYHDVYTFRYLEKGDEEEAVAYAKRDLALVASGGFSTTHIYNVGYTYRFI